MKKIKKFLRTPGIFFRDYYNKKYPYVHNEQQCIENHEPILIENDLKLAQLSFGKPSFNVDVVFTWVNDQDPLWHDQLTYYASKVNKDRIGNYALDKARFESHNELYFALKSVRTNLPWVRNIYVLTNNKAVQGYEEFKNVEFVSHDEIIPSVYLPTFNSHVIEAHLHNIPGLAENFIYFNDDVFVARPLPKGHFFQANGIASLFLTGKSLKAMKQKGVITPTLSASLKVQQLIWRDYGCIVDNPLVHTYVPLKKSFFSKAWKDYSVEIESFLSNRFRTNQDLNLPTFLIPWMMFLNRQAIVSRDICYYFNIRAGSAPLKYQKLLEKKRIGHMPHSICTNDFHSENQQNQNYKQELVTFLSQYFNKVNC